VVHSPPPNRIDAATPVDPLLAELANVTTALPIPEADVHATITDLGFGGRIVRVGSSLRSPEEFADHLGVSIDRVVKVGVLNVASTPTDTGSPPPQSK
jgi:hypothetical protein